MKIGDEIFYYDENHRVYEKDSNGRSFGGPIFKEHFRRGIITGETRDYWLIDSWGMRIKKKPVDLKFGVLTQEQVEDLVWLAVNRYKLVEKIKYSNDIVILKKIAELIGYKE